MYVYIFSYLVNKLEILWLYLSPIKKKDKEKYNTILCMLQILAVSSNANKDVVNFTLVCLLGLSSSTV